MLSRVADNLYWMSRYLERAEHTARLINVNLDLIPDRSPETIERCWQQLITSLHLPLTDDITEAMHDDSSSSGYQVVQHLTFNADNPDSVASCISLSRENARQVRELISEAMWEQINRLYLDVKNTTLKQIWQAQPHDYFQAVTFGSYLFRGVTNSTMNRGEGWHFIQIGQLIERISNITKLLEIYLQETSASGDAAQTDPYLDWVCLLRSCTAFEAYCKVYTADLRHDRIAEFLLLNDEFPHSVHFAVKTMQNGLNAVAEETEVRKNSQVYRLVGRLKAMLSYDEIGEVIAAGLPDYLQQIKTQCNKIHQATYQTYITYPIEEKLPL